MALMKKGNTPTKTEAPQTTPPASGKSILFGTPPAAKSAAPVAAKKSAPVPSALFKKGAAAQEAMAEADARAEEAAAQMGRAFRFFLPPGGETVITFLDGPLDQHGGLDVLLYKEHGIMIAGKLVHFMCVEEVDGSCPICEQAVGGDENASKFRPALVGAFTVIDHTPYSKRDGTQVPFSSKLFIAKRTTLKVLTKVATTRGGLVGCTFNVSRNGDKAPAVGDLFDFLEKNPLSALQGKFGPGMVPYNYHDEIRYVPGDELRQKGFGHQKLTPYAGAKKEANSVGNVNSDL